MSWLRVPKPAEDTPRSSNASTTSETSRYAQDESTFESGSYSDEYEDETENEESKVVIKKQFVKDSSSPDDHGSGSVAAATPMSSPREDIVDKKVKYEQDEEKEKPAERVYDNISQYYRAYHNNVTNAWYETTMNMLINKQEYAVEAVKLEWLLRKRKMPNLNNLKKSKEENLQLTEVERELELLQQTELEADIISYEGIGDRGEEKEIENTLSEISDEIMDGKGRRRRKIQRQDPKRDERRLYHLLNDSVRKVY